MKNSFRFLGVICAVAFMLTACGAPKAELALDTPYCVLEYPDEWGDALVIRDQEEGGVFSKTFSAQFSAAQYDLFTVHFGEPHQGSLYGYILAEGSRVPIYIECFMLPEGHLLTAEEAEQFYQMLDGINAVVASLQAASGYSEE